MRYTPSVGRVSKTDASYEPIRKGLNDREGAGLGRSVDGQQSIRATNQAAEQEGDPELPVRRCDASDAIFEEIVQIRFF